MNILQITESNIDDLAKAISSAPTLTARREELAERIGMKPAGLVKWFIHARNAGDIPPNATWQRVQLFIALANAHGVQLGERESLESD